MAEEDDGLEAAYEQPKQRSSSTEPPFRNPGIKLDAPAEQKIYLTFRVTISSVASEGFLNGRSCNACPRAPAPPLPDRKRPRHPGHDAAQAYYYVLVRPASSQHLFGSERQCAHAVIHCLDDDMRLLRHAALALCLAPGLVREMRPASAAGSQAGLKRGSHNDRVTKIARLQSKPTEFKGKVET
jgi:hypothetical protein